MKPVIARGSSDAPEIDGLVIIGGYALEEESSMNTAAQFGSLYKKDGTWHFKAVGQGFDKGLADFVVYYGGTLA